MLPNVAEWISGLLPSSRSPRSEGSHSLENPNVSLDDPEFWEALGHQKSDTGLKVGALDALRFGPVYQCLEIKSGDVGASTMHIHKEDVEPGQSDIDNNQSAERVCSLEWNELTSANEGWSNLVFHSELFGDGYAYIARQGGARNGPIQWMANLVPTNVEPCVDPDSKALVYKVTVDGKEEFCNSWEIFHLKGMSLGGGMGLNKINLMKNEIGLALASKLFLSKFFERGGHHGGVLMVPAAMKADARQNLEKGVAERSSPANWFRTLILRDGATWASSTIDPRTAQMHELTEDEARAVCHFYNMPPWKIGLKNADSYNSAEQAARAYITGTLTHVTSRIQAQAMMKLVTERVRRARSHRFEHNFSKLVQADSLTFNRILQIQRTMGIINANDWLKAINLPARTDAAAMEYGNPNTTAGNKNAAGTTASATNDSNNQAGANNQGPGTKHQAPSAAHRRLLDQAVLRASKRLGTVCRNKARKPNELLEWCDGKAGAHQAIAHEELHTPLECAYGEHRANILAMAGQQWLTGAMVSGVSQFLEAPHKTPDLEANVEEFLKSFQSSVVDRWNKEIVDALS